MQQPCRPKVRCTGSSHKPKPEIFTLRAQVVLNSLYKHTVLQSRFPCNAVALVAGTPETLSLKHFLQHFLEFRVDVVRRRAQCAFPPSVHTYQWKARFH